MFPVRVDLIGLLALRLRPNHGIEAKPYHLVDADLATGTLFPLKLAESDAPTSISMSAIYRTDTPPGPVGRGLIERLKQSAERTQTSDRSRSQAVSRRPAPRARPLRRSGVHGAQAGLILLRRLGSDEAAR
jgi:hypothetical protein